MKKVHQQILKLMKIGGLESLKKRSYENTNIFGKKKFLQIFV
jgi:hypothetical protein